MARLENLLGAHALSVADRLSETASARAMTLSDQSALATMLAHPDRPVSWLGGVLGLTSSGITRLVDRLVAAGWVTRTPGDDGRQRRLRLTRAGRTRARALLRDRDAVLAQCLAVLSDRERADLERLLGRLVAGVADSRLPALQTCRLCDRSACDSGGRECPLEHTADADDPYA